MYYVDPGESFHMGMSLQNLASIEPRTIVNHLFVPLRYLQSLKIIRSTAAAAGNEPCKVCPLSAYRSPRLDSNTTRANRRTRGCPRSPRSSASTRGTGAAQRWRVSTARGTCRNRNSTGSRGNEQVLLGSGLWCCREKVGPKGKRAALQGR